MNNESLWNIKNIYKPKELESISTYGYSIELLVELKYLKLYLNHVHVYKIIIDDNVVVLMYLFIGECVCASVFVYVKT